MLYLNFAPNADLLLPPLLKDIRSVWKDPFESPSFIVPNPATGKWLKLRLAEQMGCVVNPQIKAFESVLWNTLKPDNNMVFLHKEKLQQIICALLKDTLLEKDNFGPLLNYLKKKGEIDPVKRVQLSSEIARLLLEYEYNRPGVWDPDLSPAGGWRVKGLEQTWIADNKLYFSGKTGKDEFSIKESELWQHDIYQILFGKQGLLRSQKADSETSIDNQYLTLPQLYRLRHESRECGGIQFTGAPIFIFLLSKISHFHRNMLLEISLSRDIHVFLVNPCSEFWEDVDTTRGRKGKRKWSFPSNPNPPILRLESGDYNSESLTNANSTYDHPLLQLWGKSGKENITMWCQAAQYNFDFLLSEHEEQPQNRLHQLQQALLTRNGSAMSAMEPDDKSIRILAAPERGREIEVLRENLLNLIKGDNQLRFDDIVVYLPDPSKYLPYIEKIFGAYRRNEPGYIPYTVLGVDAGQSQFAVAVKDLISLCGGDFTRARVFSLLSNEMVLNARNIDHTELEIWETWAKRLGTFRGYDASHRKEMGDHEKVASDAHTFGLGIAQLLMGPLALNAVPLCFNLNSIDDVEASPFRDFNTSDKNMVEHYCSTIEELAQNCRNFKNQCGKESPSQLVDSFLNVLDSWISTSQTEEIFCRSEFRDALQELNLQESICGRNTLEFDEFKAAALSSLQQELPGSAHAWTGCLTFAPLRSGYILPHKAVFLLGMDADSFPGTSNKNLFNLLSNSPITGDPDPVSDNRYIFLELVCAASDCLIISWLGQDIQRDRILQPSSVVLELASAAGIHLPDPEKGLVDPGVIPLVAHEAINDRDFPRWDPAVSRLAEVERICSEGKRSKYRLQGVTDSENFKMFAGEKEPSLRTTVNDICTFLVNPLQYHLKRSLQLSDEEIDETSTATDEPLESNFLSLYSLKRRLLKRLMQLTFPVSEEPCRSPSILVQKACKFAQQLFVELCSSGLAPEGIFARKDLISLQNWAAETALSVTEIKKDYGNHRLYTDTDHNLSEDNVLSDFEFEYGGRNFNISAQIPFVLQGANPESPLVIIKIGGDIKEIVRNFDLWIYSLLFYLNDNDNKRITTININHGDGKKTHLEWSQPQPWSPETGKKWLAEILQEMFDTNNCEHAPAVWFEEVYNRLAKNGFSIELLVDWLRELAEKESDGENKYPLYHPGTDAFKLTEARFPDNGDNIKRVFYRLSPILTGEFFTEELSDIENDTSVVEDTFL